jgi:hypothetical protein
MSPAASTATPAWTSTMKRLASVDPDGVTERKNPPGVAASSEFLYGPVSGLPDGEARAAALAGWSLMHGLANLWISGNLPAGLGDDPTEVARAVGRHLYSGRSRRAINRQRSRRPAPRRGRARRRRAAPAPADRSVSDGTGAR